VICRKWGAASPVAKSIDDLEANPKSKGHATVLAENVAATHLASDVEVMQALAKLVAELKVGGTGGEAGAIITNNISGDAIGIVGAQNVSVGSQHFNVAGAQRMRRKN
jgi:hypothetical protein